MQKNLLDNPLLLLVLLVVLALITLAVILRVVKILVAGRRPGPRENDRGR